MQVMLLDQKRRFEIERDERVKLLCVPIWQAAGSLKSGKPADTAKSPLADLLPNIEKLRAEQAELERQLALLRYVEALRLYAAAHDGTVAKTSADLPVPLPLDPVTGKAFAYSAEATKAHIRGESLAGMAKNAGGRVHYVVNIHK
jgi:hypothetical protein